MHRISLSAVLVAIIICSGCSRQTQDKSAVSYAKFIEELADPCHIARHIGTDSHLISSSDPTGGNDDFNHFQSKEEDGWFVLADLEGPGFVSRIWTTGGGNDEKRLRFYFDGEEEPRIDASIKKLIDRGNPFVLPLAASEQSCWYSYVPITYRKSLKVLMSWDGEGKRFYHLNYTTLPQDQAVQSYPREFGDREKAALADLGKIYEHYEQSIPQESAANLQKKIAVPAGATRELFSLNGPAIVRRIAITPHVVPEMGAERKDSILSKLFVEAEWENSGKASIRVPLTAFGGHIWDVPAYESMYFGKSNGTYICRFPMPFKQSGLFRIKNLGSEPVKIKASTVVEEREEIPFDMQYFHAAWNRSGSNDIDKPHVVLHAEGTGRYCGCLLGSSSMDKSWWLLESDEFIRSDGANRPQWRGTGLEDYFNGAWYYRNNLVRPLHGLVFKVPFLTVQYRIHQNDAPGFDSDIDVWFERGPSNKSRGLLESIAFYYMNAPGQTETPVDGKLRMGNSFPHEKVTVMQSLANFERLGDYQGACEYIDLYLERYPDVPFAEMLKLRRISCMEAMRGFKAVENQYRQFLANSKTKRPKACARMLLWQHQKFENAILTVNSKMPATVYLDGKQVGSVNAPTAFGIFVVEVDEGRHAVSIETTQGGHPGWMHWVQLCLRTGDGMVMTGSDWRFAWNPNGEWTSSKYDASSWNSTVAMREGPPMRNYAWFSPHPFADMHSQPWAIWASEAGNGKLVFRKEFTVSK